MTREEIYELAEHNSGKYLALELPTGFGKTKVALDIIAKVGAMSKPSVLLLVAKKVHKQNWKDEMDKWGLLKDADITVECYESLKKHGGETYDYIIADEAHHLNSDMRREFFKSITARYKALLLSATIPRDLRMWLKFQFHTQFITATLQEAVSDNVLPTPEIILLPLDLDNTEETETIEVNPKTKGEVFIGRYMSDYWKARKQRVHAKLSATKKQYLQWMNHEILRLKNSFMCTHNEAVKMKWLKMCSDRLKFLAECKTPVVAQLLYRKKDCRTLTFCNNIEQAEELGTHCIHSKNTKAEEMLDSFNKGKINHITAVQMLNEGVNLKDCQYGIFANINASQIIQTQRIGRLLRHKQPRLIIPYYKGSREEELVMQMVGGYDKKLIKTYENIERVL